MKFLFTPILLSLILSAALAACGDSENKSSSDSTPHAMPAPMASNDQNRSKRIRVRNIGRLPELFNDSNLVQLRAARRLGIDPVTSLSSSYFTKRPIIHIISNDFYTVDSLSHSVPFLVPEAAALLHDIGSNFIDSLSNRGADGYRIRVTSLLRTPETVRSLRKVNINATDSSTHQFATTFDISYVKFHPSSPSREIEQEDLKNLLAEVLLDLRQAGRCYVKYEKKTGCFHVTVR